MFQVSIRFGLAVLVGTTALAASAAELPSRLRVLVAADENPEIFSFEDAGRPGLERELLEGFCRIHGLELAVVPVRDFHQMIPMLLRGEGDVITGIVDTVARRKAVAFSREVLPVRHLVVTRRPTPRVASVEDLKTLRVGVIPGTSWEQATVDAGVPTDRRLAFRDANLLMAGLRAAQVDAVVMPLVDYALAAKRDPQLEAGIFVGTGASDALAVRPTDKTLLAALDGYLESAGQARHALIVRYLSQEALSLIALARRE
jgi:ABC-type amino acid transport substrate-binding protein